MMNSNGTNGWHDEILAKIDDNRQVYLCEYGVVHFKWDKNDLVYCPGDFIGLSFLLSGLANQCNRECVHGEPCPHEAEDGLVYLQYHSVKLPFPQNECLQMHDLALMATKRLHALRNSGFFTQQVQKNMDALAPNTQLSQTEFVEADFDRLNLP
ncbi:MAG TPA: hypothetical protein EYP90_08865 [Chromatiaceae bacterium]|nr:hypothetical protein [Chromatiaceae bacterium]